MLPPTQTALSYFLSLRAKTRANGAGETAGLVRCLGSRFYSFALNVPQEIQVLGRYGIASLLCNMYPKAK